MDDLGVTHFEARRSLAGGELSLTLDTKRSPNTPRGYRTTAELGPERRLRVSLQGTTEGAYDFSLDSSSMMVTTSRSSLDLVRLGSEFLELLADYYGHLVEQGQKLHLRLPGAPQERVLKLQATGVRGSMDKTPELRDLVMAGLLSHSPYLVRHERLTKMQEWLESPPQVTTPQELWLQLTCPTWRVTKPQHLWVSRSTLNNLPGAWGAEDVVDLLGGINFLLQLLWDKRISEATLKATLGEVRVQDLMAPKDINPQSVAHNPVVYDVEKLPLGTKKFRQYLRSLPVEKVLALTVESSINRGMGAQAAMDYVEQWWGSQAHGAPTSLEVVQLIHDLLKHHGQNLHLPVIGSFINSFENLPKKPLAYACYRAWVARLEAGEDTLNGTEELRYIRRGSPWLRGGSKNSEVTLTLLVNAVGASRAAEAVMAVARQGKPPHGHAVASLRRKLRPW